MIILLAVLGAGGGQRAGGEPLGRSSPSPPPSPSRSSWASTCATGGRAKCWRLRSSASSLVLAAVFGGQYRAESAAGRPMLHAAATSLAWAIIVYGFARQRAAGLAAARAARLPQHFHEAGHDRSCSPSASSFVAPRTADARPHQLHRRQRPGLRRARSFPSASSPSPAARSAVSTR